MYRNIFGLFRFRFFCVYGLLEVEAWRVEKYLLTTMFVWPDCLLFCEKALDCESCYKDQMRMASFCVRRLVNFCNCSSSFLRSLKEYLNLPNNIFNGKGLLKDLKTLIILWPLWILYSDINLLKYCLKIRKINIEFYIQKLSIYLIQ